MENKIKIGIIGPRPSSVGGHDFNNNLREVIRHRISITINHYLDQSYDITGVTGLNIGVEQDFALACLENKIPYIGVLPFDNQESRWSNIPNMNEIYKEFVDRADHCIPLMDGGYSPKKMFSKHKEVIKISDIIIYVNNSLFPVNKELVEFAEALDKGVLFMDIES